MKKPIIRALRRVREEMIVSVAWCLCEIAFRADMRFGTEWLYRAGCWLYGRA